MSKKDQKPKSSLKVVPAAPARKARREGGAGIDFESVRELARIAAEFDLAEVEADGSGHVRVRRGGGGSVEAAPAMSGPRSIALTPAPAAAARRSRRNVHQLAVRRDVLPRAVAGGAVVRRGRARRCARARSSASSRR